MNAAPRAPARSAPGPGGAAAAGAPGGGLPGLGSIMGPNGPDMAQLMAYLPTIMKVASQVPGILVGFFLTVLYMLLVVGRKGFTETVSPVAGFHVFVFFLVRELIEPWQQGRARAAAARARESQRRSFTTDIAMRYREKLD